MIGMSNEADKTTLEPNIFDLLSDARWVCADAVVAVRLIAENIFSRNATTEDQYLQAEVALEKFATIIGDIASLTTTLPNTYVHPKDVEMIVRETKRTVRVERIGLNMLKKAREIEADAWRVALTEWAMMEGMGEK
jgi:hypothetical protein